MSKKNKKRQESVSSIEAFIQLFRLLQMAVCKSDENVVQCCSMESEDWMQCAAMYIGGSRTAANPSGLANDAAKFADQLMKEFKERFDPYSKKEEKDSLEDITADFGDTVTSDSLPRDLAEQGGVALGGGY